MTTYLNARPAAHSFLMTMLASQSKTVCAAVLTASKSPRLTTGLHRSEAMEYGQEPTECPHCGHVGPIEDFYDDSDIAQAVGALQCPECDSCIWDPD